MLCCGRQIPLKRSGLAASYSFEDTQHLIVKQVIVSSIVQIIILPITYFIKKTGLGILNF